MSSRRKRRASSKDTDLRPSKKQKVEEKEEKEENEEDFDIMNDLDLDLNIVVGSNKTPINLNNYNDGMKEIQIDQHIYFQFNSNNCGHNVLWKNKCILTSECYEKYQKLIINNNKYCHFHQPSPQEMLQLYNLSPSSLKKSVSVGTILYNIHKSVMCTFSENQYGDREKKKLQKDLINLDISSLQQIPTNDSSSNNKMEIDDYGWKNNVFHKLSSKYGISPVLLIRDYLKCNFGVLPDVARKICILINTLKITDDSKLLIMLNTTKDNINKLYSINLSIPILHSIYFGLRFDCIRSYSPHFAWINWNKKIINSNNKLLIKIFEKSKGRGSHFLEHTLIGKFRAIIDKINDKIKNENDKYTILNEVEQKIKIQQLKQEKIRFYKEQNPNDIDLEQDEILNKIGWNDPSTPDLLFNKPLMINGSYINWIDAKNYFITFQDKLKYRSLMRQSRKYVNTFGCGAIVCIGFVKKNDKSSLYITNGVIILDASYWTLNK